MNPARILLLYTGGTIGSFEDHRSGSLVPVDFRKLTEFLPEMHKLQADISIATFDQPKDSSDIHPEDWIRMVEIIEENYDRYDGFVILHGTDTMSYSASALSFMLEGLNKPVIFTGSQLPIGMIRTDGRENLITALEIAATRDENGNPLVPEVALYFEYKLFRGNRSLKYSADHFHAYVSPNYPLLAEAGVTINYDREHILPYKPGTPRFHKLLDNNIITMKLFPGIGRQIPEIVSGREGIRAIILETFGFGNGPLDDWFGKWLEEMEKKGVIILNITQCLQGSVQQGRYGTSRQFVQAGVTSGADMTIEAAITKLMFLLGRYKDPVQVKEKLRISLSGELTVH